MIDKPDITVGSEVVVMGILETFKPDTLWHGGIVGGSDLLLVVMMMIPYRGHNMYVILMMFSRHFLG